MTSPITTTTKTYRAASEFSTKLRAAVSFGTNYFSAPPPPPETAGYVSDCEEGLHAAPCLVCRFPRATRVTRAIMRTTTVSLAKSTMQGRCVPVVGCARARSLKKSGGAGASSAKQAAQAAQKQEQDQGGGGLAGSRRADRDERIVVAKVLRT